LRSMLDRQLGDSFIFRRTEDQDRDLGRRAKEPEGVNSVAVGQEEVDQHRRYGVRSLLFLLCFPGQSFQTNGAAPDPFDLKGPIA
jgi:hypothetical protein